MLLNNFLFLKNQKTNLIMYPVSKIITLEYYFRSPKKIYTHMDKLDKEDIADKESQMDERDTMDNRMKKDKFHNLKLSTQTFDKFHQVRNKSTLKLGKTRIENDIFLKKMLHFVEKNIEDFVISYDEPKIED